MAFGKLCELSCVFYCERWLSLQRTSEDDAHQNSMLLGILVGFMPLT